MAVQNGFPISQVFLHFFTTFHYTFSLKYKFAKKQDMNVTQKVSICWKKIICVEFRSELSMVTFVLLWSISFLPLILGDDDLNLEGLRVKIIKESQERTTVENPNGK